jgi:membrane associated rhomboid family serine protease
MTLIEIINILSGRVFISYGISPREISGLLGILLSPFIYGSIGHYLANIIPFGLFTFLILQQGTKKYLLVSLIGMILTGFAVWLIGSKGLHVGASGVVYSYFGFLVVNGLVSKDIKLIVISLLVFLGYGGMVWGVLPNQLGVSWESHLFGLLIGSTLGYKLKNS